LNNAFADATGEISVEALLEANPDILLLVNYTGGRAPEESLADLKANDALSSLTAIQEDRVYTIDLQSVLEAYGYQNFNRYGTTQHRIVFNKINVSRGRKKVMNRIDKQRQLFYISLLLFTVFDYFFGGNWCYGRTSRGYLSQNLFRS